MCAGEEAAAGGGAGGWPRQSADTHEGSQPPPSDKGPAVLEAPSGSPMIRLELRQELSLKIRAGAQKPECQLRRLREAKLKGLEWLVVKVMVSRRRLWELTVRKAWAWF